MKNPPQHLTFPSLNFTPDVILQMEVVSQTLVDVVLLEVSTGSLRAMTHDLANSHSLLFSGQRGSGGALLDQESK